MPDIRPATRSATRRPRAPKAAAQIAGVLRDEIVTGKVADGERLGSGHELLERFGVSRPTLREAFRILEAESIIEIERGVHGGVVARRPREDHTIRAMATLLESRGVTLADVYEARTVIEPAAARRVAQSRSRRSKAKVLRVHVEAQAAVLDDPVAFAAANMSFHEALVRESGNHTLALLDEVLHDIVQSVVTRLAAQDADATGHGFRQRMVDDQRHLLALLEGGDADEAESWWRSHMERIGEAMLHDGDATIRHRDLHPTER